jgi:hypothetical protein
MIERYLYGTEISTGSNGLPTQAQRYVCVRGFD